MDHSLESVAGEVFTRLLMAAVGLMMLVPAINKLHIYSSLILFGNHADGIVVYSSSGRDWGGRPLLQYRDEQNIIHEFKSRAKTHWFKKPIKGEIVEIFFDKKTPDKAIVNNFYYYVFLPLLFAAVGCYCCFKSIWFHTSKWRGEEK